MKRVLGIILVIFIVAIALSPIVYFLIQVQHDIKSTGDIFINSKTVLDFAMAALQVFVIAMIIGIATKYWLLRPYRFVFKGFSNANMLADIEKRPLDFDMVARAELIEQFRSLYQEFTNYPHRQQPNTPKKELDTNILLRNNHHAYSHAASEDLDNNNLSFLPSEKEINEIARKTLEKVIQALANQKDFDLLRVLGDNAPTQISPVMQLINAVISSRIVTITGHLQWQSDTKQAGITFEIDGPDKLHNIVPQTIWWEATSDRVAPNRIKAMEDKTPLSDDVEMIKVVDCYLDLLKPAMRWLVFIYFEYYQRTRIPLINRVFSWKEKQRLANLYYLLGILYDVCFTRYPAYKFFHDFSAKYFSLAIDNNPNWSSPYLYLANIYAMTADNEEHPEEFYKQAAVLYQKARSCAEEEMKQLNASAHASEESKHKLQYTIYKIAVDEALAKLEPENNSYTKEEFDELKRSIPELQSPDAKLEDVDASYLYNLALLCTLVHGHALAIDKPDKLRTQVQRFLEKSLHDKPELRKLAQDNKDFTRWGVLPKKENGEIKDESVLAK